MPKEKTTSKVKPKKKSTPKKPVNKIETKKEEIIKPKKKKPYFGYVQRIVLNVLLIIIMAGALVYSGFKTFYITDNETISYHENSKINYQVHLKENDFYDTPYLNKGMAYIASLIDKINIDFNYMFYSNKTNSIDIYHKAVAKLVIASQNNDKVFYENEYELAGKEVENIVDKYEYDLNESVVIDYDYYNNLANEFKNKYAVATNSYLEVYLQVDEVRNNKSHNLINESKTILTIPLSHREINIGLKESTVDTKNHVTSKAKLAIENDMFIYCDLVLLILLLVLIIRLIKKVHLLIHNKSKYDLYVNKLLRSYDRIIVNVKTAPNLNNYNVIKVDSFQELIDVRDNIKEPIQYFIVTEHQKCEFFCVNHNDLYIYVVKAVDIEK